MSTPSISVVIAAGASGKGALRALSRAVESAAGTDVIVVGARGRGVQGAVKGARCIAEPAGGAAFTDLAAMRNAGAAASDAQALLFLGADRALAPGALAALRRALRGADKPGGGDPGVAFAYGSSLGADGSVQRAPEWDPVVLGATNPFGAAPILIARDRFDAAGGFDETLGAGEAGQPTLADWCGTWDLALRFAADGLRGERAPEAVFGAGQLCALGDGLARPARVIGQLSRKHQPFFRQYGMEALIRANVMLRRSDANWIDETGYPIPHQVLYRMREEYESMTAVRVHRAAQRALAAIRR